MHTVAGMLQRACICLGATALLAVAPATASAEVEARVVGGGTVDISAYPWQAAITVDPDKASGNALQRLRCGGSLLTSRIVITASHCVENGDPDCDGASPGLPCTVLTDPSPGDGTRLNDPDDLSVVLGRTTLTNGSQGAEHELIDIVMHPSYDPSDLDNDVALLVLAGPSSQPPIKIAGEDERDLWQPGIATEVSGWGAVSQGGPISDTLKAAVTPIISDEACGSSSVYGSEFHPGTMVCAGYLQGGTDTCQGDSGGPLESPAEGGFYRLVGITSWGYGCAGPDAPGVYTRIARAVLRSWVASEVDLLETEHGLPDEQVVGSGGDPRSSGGDPAPPPVITSQGGDQAGKQQLLKKKRRFLKTCKRVNKKRAKRGQRKLNCKKKARKRFRR